MKTSLAPNKAVEFVRPVGPRWTAKPLCALSATHRRRYAAS